MMKIAFVVGARPQFIKMNLLVKEFEANGHATFVIHTDQHYDYLLSQSFFEQLGIDEPDAHLGVGSGTQGKQTGRMLEKIEEVLLEEKPDLMVVFGDTNSTLAGALAACKLHIRVAHVEAGLRNYDKKKPEEINRIVTDHVSDIFFAPTEHAKRVLQSEGITKNIHVVGDVSNDVLQSNLGRALEVSRFLEDQGLDSKSYFLLTVHKSKNTDSRRNLEAIIKAMVKLNEKIIFPVHPRTRKVLAEYGLMSNIEGSLIKLIDPLTYFDMIAALYHSRKIITDSGGIQKEAYALEIPCITLRKTEWVETVEDGWNVQVDIHNKEEVIDTVRNFLPNQERSNFLGDGKSYKKIFQTIDEWLKS